MKRLGGQYIFAVQTDFIETAKLLLELLADNWEG